VKAKYNKILSGSRLASAAGGLGRDDELRNILWWEEIIVFQMDTNYDREPGLVEELEALGEGVLERIFAVFTITMGGHGQAEGMCPKMGDAAKKIHGFFRVSFF